MMFFIKFLISLLNMEDKDTQKEGLLVNDKTLTSHNDSAVHNDHEE